MKLFIIGPKTDRDVIQDHRQAAEFWRELGHQVVSTAELDVAEGADALFGWEPMAVSDEYLSDIFRRNVSTLVTCDAVVLLGGWQSCDESKTLLDVATFADMTAFVAIGKNQQGQFLYEEIDEEFDYDDEDSTSEAGSPEFHRIIRNIVDLHNKKNQDYGKTNDPFYNMRAAERYGIPAWVSCMIRSDDKSHRIQKAYTDGPESLANESVIDSFEDKIVYDIMALVLYRESLAARGS